MANTNILLIMGRILAVTNVGGPSKFKSVAKKKASQLFGSSDTSLKNNSITRGFVLPMVIAGGLILMLGAIILSMRSFSSLKGSIRQNQGTRADEIAETGANKIIQELNQNYPYLLVVNCAVTNNSASEQTEPPECENGWESYKFDSVNPISKCAQRKDLPDDIEVFREVLYQPAGKGYYRLRSYEFFGDQIQGGTAVIQVQGQLRTGPADNQKIAASAILQKEVTIVPKCCDLALFKTCSNSSGWKYGLTAGTIALQTGDVIDEDSEIDVSGANVNCTSCTSNPPQNKCAQWNDVGQNISTFKKNTCETLINKTDIAEEGAGYISGERSNDDVTTPDAPTWNPEWKRNGKEMEPMVFVNQNKTFGHLDQEGAHPNKSCYTEIKNEKKITHCRIESITNSNLSKFRIQPGESGEIRFYIEGEAINLSGKQFLMPDNAKFGQFAILGSNNTSSLNFSGEGEINAFLYMPKTKVSFSGGICNPLINPLILRGVAIVNRYEATGDCAQIRVPTDAGNTLCENYNLCSNKSSGSSEELEYVAVGTKRWDYVQMGP